MIGMWTRVVGGVSLALVMLGGGIAQNTSPQQIQSASTDGNPIVFLSAHSPPVVGAGIGDDIYLLTPGSLADGQTVTVSDAQGDNRLQLADGLQIASSVVTRNALRLILSNGAQVDVLGADSFRYQVCGNALKGLNPAPLAFADFVADTLNLAAPTKPATQVSGGAVTIHCTDLTVSSTAATLVTAPQKTLALAVQPGSPITVTTDPAVSADQAAQTNKADPAITTAPSFLPRAPSINPPRIEQPELESQRLALSPLVAPAAAPTVEWTWHRTTDGQHPNGNEQQIVWLMNRARQAPAVEGNWLATTQEGEVAFGRDFFNVNKQLLQNQFAAIAAKPPAAFDVRLYQAAKAHSDDLIARDAQDHNNQFQRIRDAGFNYATGRGNVFSYATSALNAHTAWNIDWGGSPATGGIQDPPGHRLAIMAADGDYTNVGIAAVPESNTNTQVGPLVTTGNYCKAIENGVNHFNRFIVGTVWRDLNSNGRYDPGEGVGGVTVTPDKGAYFAVTAIGGGFAIPVSTPDTYALTFSGAGLPTTHKSVTVGSQSVLLDNLIGSVTTQGLAVTKAGSGFGAVTSSPAGINCGSDCSESYATGTRVTLTASPDAYSAFVGWLGACTGSALTCTFTTGASDQTVAAYFSGPDLAVGNWHNLALKSDGTVWAWGYNNVGQLGNGTTISRSPPMVINTLRDIIAVSGGVWHSVAVASGGAVWAWGNNSYGQAGGATGQYLLPVAVNGLNNVITAAAGAAHTVALKNDGTVWAWGSNHRGQLGDGTTTDHSLPGPVTGLNNVIAIATGGYHSVALKGDGTVWTWGSNSHGQIGDGSTTKRALPVPVAGLSQIIAIAGQGDHTLALKSDGTVWGWGLNAVGQLGDGSTTDRMTPVAVSGLTQVIAIAANFYHSAALKSDGTVWTWGYNDYGQLGDGTTTSRSTPVKVSGLSNVIAIAVGDRHTLALKNDGTVWAWGSNWSGALGDSTATDSATNRLTSVQVQGSGGTARYLNLLVDAIAYPLTVTKAGTGTGTVTGAGNYAAGATVALTATPAAGSTFTGWSPSPCAASFLMPANALTCTATFTLANQAPQVNAGADQTITLPATASLAGTVTDDGLPNPPGTVTRTWSKVSGPGTVTFANAASASTNATFSIAGTYVLRLTASDSALSASDEVQVTVLNSLIPAVERIEFVSDQSLFFGAPGQRRTLTVQVYDANGVAIPNAVVDWSSTVPDTVTVRATGPLSAEVIAKTTWSGTISITATYAPFGISAHAYAVMGTLAPQAVLAGSEAVLAIEGDRLAEHQVTLTRTAQTEQLKIGQILVTGNQAGVLVRILRVTLLSDRVVLWVEPVAINEAFKDLDLRVEGEPMPITIEMTQNGTIATLSPSGYKRLARQMYLPQYSLRNSLKCNIPLGANFDVPILAFHNDLIPRLGLQIENHKIVDFLLMLQGDIGIDAGLRLNLSGSIGLECKVTLPDIALARVPLMALGVISAQAVLMPEIGFKVEAEASTSIPLQQNFNYSCSWAGGIRYTVAQDWQAIGDAKCDSKRDDKAFALDTALTLKAGPFIQAGSQFELYLSDPSVKFLKFKFLSLKLLDFSSDLSSELKLPLPLDPRQQTYKGPEEELKVSAKASVDIKSQVFEGKLDKLLHLERKIDLKWVLFSLDSTIYRTAKPTGSVTCVPNCSAVPSDGSGSVTLLAQADTTDTGKVEFWASINGNPLLIKLAEAPFAGGQGQAVYKPVGATAGDVYAIYPRLKLDTEEFGFTQLLPLASENAERMGIFTVASNDVIDDKFLAHFPDSALRACVSNWKGRLVSDVIGLACYDSGLQNLSGIELLTQLSKVYIRSSSSDQNSQISDLKPLSTLTQLKVLELDYNRISDLKPLSTLTQLEELWLSNNQISDLKPLSTLTQLEKLYLSNNQISDLKPLSTLTKLTFLELVKNQIVDVAPISSLTKLTFLTLDLNQIVDVAPLGSLTKLKFLSIGRNLITDISPLFGLGAEIKFASASLISCGDVSAAIHSHGVRINGFSVCLCNCHSGRLASLLVFNIVLGFLCTTSIFCQ